MTQSVTAARGRAGADACPGALRTHRAADGELARVRVPGGALTAAQLRALAAAAADLAAGRLELTSRGNLQVRGIRAGAVPDLVDRLRGAGLLPDDDHERVRNVVASPLSGRGSGSTGDVDPLVRALDAALCADPDLVGLPGRFLFALDDGSGDVAGEGADVLIAARPDGDWRVLPAGTRRGLTVPGARAVAAALAVARAFVAELGAGERRAWRVAELPGGGDRLLERLRADGWTVDAAAAPDPAATPDPAAAPGPATDPGPAAAPVGPPEPGLVEQRDDRFAVCALARLGHLDREQADALATATELAGGDALRVTPWRRLLVRDLGRPAALAVRELLSAVDLGVRPGTAWSRVTACTGRPGCARALADVRADAVAFAGSAPGSGPAVHFAGCDRGCGTPAGADVLRMVATGTGYRREPAR